MLVLTRKIGERLFIGLEVVVTVTKIDGKRVCLGIEAPKSCPIQREELLAKGLANPNPSTSAVIPLKT